MNAPYAPAPGSDYRSIPSKPKAVFRAIQSGITNVVFEELDGLEVIVEGMNDWCGPSGHYHFDVRPPKPFHGTPIIGVSGQFLDFVDKSDVPKTHAHHPATVRAWLCGKYKREAFPQASPMEHL